MQTNDDPQRLEALLTGTMANLRKVFSHAAYRVRPQRWVLPCGPGSDIAEIIPSRWPENPELWCLTVTVPAWCGPSGHSGEHCRTEIITTDQYLSECLSWAVHYVGMRCLSQDIGILADLTNSFTPGFTSSPRWPNAVFTFPAAIACRAQLEQKRDAA